MNSSSLARSRFRTAAALALVSLLLPLTAYAAIVSWAFDKTPHDAYYQFSNSTPFDAQRGVLIRAGATVADLVWDPPGLVMGSAGEFHGLPPATAHTLRVFVRATPASPWTLVRTQNFVTDP